VCLCERERVGRGSVAVSERESRQRKCGCVRERETVDRRHVAVSDRDSGQRTCGCVRMCVDKTFGFKKLFWLLLFIDSYPIMSPTERPLLRPVSC
jgi:hypothetical protein